MAVGAEALESNAALAEIGDNRLGAFDRQAQIHHFAALAVSVADELDGDAGLPGEDLGNRVERCGEEGRMTVLPEAKPSATGISIRKPCVSAAPTVMPGRDSVAVLSSSRSRPQSGVGLA